MLLWIVQSASSVQFCPVQGRAAILMLSLSALAIQHLQCIIACCEPMTVLPTPIALQWSGRASGGTAIHKLAN